jgi:predicted site-specific integrase-resolvase
MVVLDGKKLVSLEEAKTITGYSTYTLRNKIKDGDIPAVFIKNKWMIEEEDLALHMKKVSNRSVHELSRVESTGSQDHPFLELEMLIEKRKLLVAETNYKAVTVLEKVTTPIMAS